MRLSVVLFVAAMAGCATASREDCQQPYEVGYRDGLFGVQPQDTLYQPICTRHGAPLNTARYAEGWRDGYYDFEQRRVHGVD